MDPIWYRGDLIINIRCQCGRRLRDRVGHFATSRGLSDKMKLYELAERVKCTVCGARPKVDFEGWR